VPTALPSSPTTFNHGALSGTPSTVFGVQVNAYARKDDVSNINVRTKLISGGTTQNGASVAITTNYNKCTDIYTTDPNTSAAWMGANVNATKIGYERI
jgi:septal ring-binding cell division protein DamX